MRNGVGLDEKEVKIVSRKYYQKVDALKNRCTLCSSRMLTVCKVRIRVIISDIVQ
jgi:hypothetical protein